MRKEDTEIQVYLEECSWIHEDSNLWSSKGNGRLGKLCLKLVQGPSMFWSRGLASFGTAMTFMKLQKYVFFFNFVFSQMLWLDCGIEFKYFFKTRNIYQMLYQGYFQVFKFQCTAVVMYIPNNSPPCCCLNTKKRD